MQGAQEEGPNCAEEIVQGLLQGARVCWEARGTQAQKEEIRARMQSMTMRMVGRIWSEFKDTDYESQKNIIKTCLRLAIKFEGWDVRKGGKAICWETKRETFHREVAVLNMLQWNVVA